MSVDQSQQDSHSLTSVRFLRPSHRTRPEQLVGLGIYLILCLGFQLLGGWLAQFSNPVYTLLCAAYFLSLGLSMWSLWRRNSLRVLKLELSLFLAQFLFQMLWCLSFFVLQQTLLALVAILLLWSLTLLAGLLFWKKERLSGALLLFPICWVFYLVGLNMVICISNP